MYNLHTNKRKTTKTWPPTTYVYMCICVWKYIFFFFYVQYTSWHKMIFPFLLIHVMEVPFDTTEHMWADKFSYILLEIFLLFIFHEIFCLFGCQLRKKKEKKCIFFFYWFSYKLHSISIKPWYGEATIAVTWIIKFIVNLPATIIIIIIRAVIVMQVCRVYACICMNARLLLIRMQKEVLLLVFVHCRRVYKFSYIISDSQKCIPKSLLKRCSSSSFFM